jgi:hypothetical protein
MWRQRPFEQRAAHAVAVLLSVTELAEHVVVAGLTEHIVVAELAEHVVVAEQPPAALDGAATVELESSELVQHLLVTTNRHR